MKWATSLIRISNHQVEMLQKQLASLVELRMTAEMKLVMLEAEAEAENDHAKQDAEAGFYRLGFLQGWRMRRDKALADIETAKQLEADGREALTQAFEELKKFEHAAELAKVAEAKEMARRETAAMDEMGLRQSQGR